MSETPPDTTSESPPLGKTPVEAPDGAPDGAPDEAPDEAPDGAQGPRDLTPADPASSAEPLDERSGSSARNAPSEEASPREREEPANPGEPAASPKGRAEPRLAAEESCARRLEDIEAELGALFYRLYHARQELTGLKGPARDTAVELRLAFEANPRRDETGRDSRSTSLFDQLHRSAVSLADRSAAFPSGHVYCYWCRSFRCEHAAPSDARTIFAGYSATGQPVWREFASVLLDRGDPRIDLLYRPEGATLPLTQSGGELAREQLAVYGRKSPVYRILGQVSLGYLRPPKGPGSSEIREPFALTFQAVEAAGGDSPAHLNILGCPGGGLPAARVLEEFYDPRLMDAVFSTRRRLSEIALGRSSRRRNREKARKVLDALRTLAKNFDRIFRQTRRRTLHSQSRRRQRGRPTSVALQDTLNASIDRVFRDVEERTWVVIGPKNRVHVFNDAALHVTSVVYSGDTVRGRTTKGKWITPEREEASRFIEDVRARAHEGRTEHRNDDATGRADRNARGDTSP